VRNDPEQQLSFLETELQAYRVENDRLARELVLTRRVIKALHLDSIASPRGMISTPVLLPRAPSAGDDVFFHLDRCEIAQGMIRIAGWAFCPRIAADKAKPAILLESANATFLVRPHSVQRPDVAAYYARAELGPACVDRSKLAHSGFSVFLERANLFDVGSNYQVSVQIDGPTFSIRKSTGINLHE
jgi:hypothetical protein